MGGGFGLGLFQLHLLRLDPVHDLVQGRLHLPHVGPLLSLAVPAPLHQVPAIVREVTQSLWPTPFLHSTPQTLLKRQKIHRDLILSIS